MENCLKHGSRFRCRLEFVLNQLRRAGKLTHSQSARIGGILCTCQNKDQSAQECDFIDREFSKSYTQVQKLLDPGQGRLDKENIFSSHSAKVLLDSLKSLEIVNQDGLKRLVVMLAKIVNSEFDQTYPTCRTNSKNDKLTTVLALNLPWDYIGFLIGKCGQGFQEIRKKTECSIKLQGREMISDAQHIMIRIESGSVANLDMARTLLRERARKVTEKRKIHEQRVRDYDDLRNKKRLSSLLAREKSKNHEQSQTKGGFQDIKNLNKAEYHRKKTQQHKMHNSGTKIKGHRALAEGSRCLNCLGTFAATEMREGACKFHPGFIVDEEWSCCGKSSTDHHPSHNDHKMTGCSNSVHNYRPTQKRHGKSSLNSPKESKSSLLQDATELLQDFKL